MTSTTVPAGPACFRYALSRPSGGPLAWLSGAFDLVAMAAVIAATLVHIFGSTSAVFSLATQTAVFVFATAAFALAPTLHRLTSPEVEIGQAAVVLRHLGHERQIAYTEIRSVDWDAFGVELALASGSCRFTPTNRDYQWAHTAIRRLLAPLFWLATSREGHDFAHNCNIAQLIAERCAAAKAREQTYRTAVRRVGSWAA